MARQASRSVRTRWTLGLAAAAAVVSLAAVGCDTDTGRADKRVDENLQKAEATAGTPESHSALDAAAKESGASPLQQMRAKAQLADAELTTADELAATAAANSAEIDRLAREILGLTRSVAADNQLVDALGKYQPDPILSALKSQADAITGSDDKPDWVKTDSGSLGSVAATDKAAAALQGQVSQLQQQIRSESDQRDGLLAQADQLTRQSQRGGDRAAALGQYTQAAGLRRQAADVGVKIDLDNGQLAHAQADLAVVAAQQAALKAAAKSAADRTAGVNQSWAAVQEQINAVRSHSAAQLGEASDTPAAPARGGKGGAAKGPFTITGRAVLLAAKVKENRQVQDEAETHYNSAIGFYTDAYKLATTVSNELSDDKHLGSPTRPDRADRDAWQAEKAAVDPAQFRYLAASATIDRAGFHARAAAQAKAVTDLTATVQRVLDAAKLTVPTALDQANTEATKDLSANQKLAADGYKEAVDSLDDVANGSAGQELKHGASVGTMFAQYAWSALATISGDAAGANTHMQAARAARDTAVSQNAPMPALPLDLTLAAAAAPGTTPAPQPPKAP